MVTWDEPWVANALEGAKKAPVRSVGAADSASDTLALSRLAHREGDLQQSRACVLAYALTTRSQAEA